MILINYLIKIIIRKMQAIRKHKSLLEEKMTFQIGWSLVSLRQEKI
jgi:hypothetical protein